MAGAPDLSGKCCMVTGATSGHGRAVAMALAAMGADTVLVGRSLEKCLAVQSEIRAMGARKPGILVCDLSSLTDIRRAAEEFLSLDMPLHILVNNAGLVSERYRETVDGFEETFAVNYLAMFLLTLLLIERIRKSAPARIINISSDTHYMADLDMDDIEGRRRRYSFLSAYGRSKLAIVYFTRELARRLSGTGVTVNAVDPGPVRSNIANKPGALAAVARAIIRATFPRPERAARTAVYCAASEELEGASSGYYRFMKKKEPRVSSDPEFGARLWEMSARMVGIDTNTFGL
jgi:NAD(P)-dependent dehydrogenase (short-subunit alcohol dehydrogenase family)